MKPKLTFIYYGTHARLGATTTWEKLNLVTFGIFQMTANNQHRVVIDLHLKPCRIVIYTSFPPSDDSTLN